ncbi:hypothetical protein [Gemmatimonas sp.]|jgi:hypothetical protein|uniref:hypothetical protein n=1 Tax=Gemmatimonas sp. TaxID=1962908 RepID=UPI0037BE8533
MAQPIPYEALAAAMQHHKNRGRISSRCLGKDGKWGTWTAATLTSAISDVQTGLIHAAMELLPADERSPARARYALDNGRFMHDIRPLLPRVPDVLREHRATPDSRRNSAQRAERLLRALVSGLTNRSPAAVRAAVFAPEWQGVINAALAHTPRISQSALNGLMHLATGASAAGLSPTDLPSSPRELAELLTTMFPDRTRFFVRSTIRQLAQLSISGVPAWPIPSATHSSRRLHPDLPEHRRLAEMQVPALAGLASEFSKLRADGKLGMKPDTALGIERALDRISSFAAQAVAAGTVPAKLAASRNIWSWWTTHLDVLGPASASPMQSGVSTDSGFFGEFVEDPGSGGVPALIAVLVWAARNGLMKKAASGKLPRSVRTDANAAWRASQAILKIKLHAHRPTSTTQAQIESAREEYRKGLEALEKHESTTLTVKDKKTALRMATLPILLSLILPWWTLIELPRLATVLEGIEQRLDKINKSSETDEDRRRDEHPEEQRATERYAVALEEWFALASAVADPLRIKNVWKGRVGTHGVEYTVTADFSEDGAIKKIIRVESNFGGDEHSEKLGNVAAALKTGFYGSRDWDWAAVAADPKWVKTYLERVWHPRLVRHGLVLPGTSIREALGQSRFPLFVAERARQRALRKAPPLPGAYGSAHTIRQRYRAALLTALRVMGADELGLVSRPIPDDEKDAVRLWPFLLSPHIARLWWVSHLFGVMHKSGIQLRKKLAAGREQLIDPLTLVRRATTDTDETMKKEYDATEDYHRKIALRDPALWQHPLFYQDIVDFLSMPDRQPDLAAFWEKWAQSVRNGEPAMPPRFAEAWAKRGSPAENRVPAVRRRRRKAMALLTDDLT